MTSRSSSTVIVSVLIVISCALATPAAAQQQRMTDVLSFLLTNRSIRTDDFARDEEAARSTRDTIGRLLLTELARLPVSSPASGFTYRLNPALGTDARSSESFGPFFVQRSLTGGEGQAAFGISFRWVAFDQIDGRSLTDGTLVATASRQRGEALPFDSETLRLRIDTQTITASATYGVTDRLDIGAAAPFVTLRMRGERLDTYRGEAFPQASAHASASGLGDILLVIKYNAFRRGGSGVAIGGEATLPTGDEENFLGAGEAIVAPRLIGSFERDRVAVHGEGGFVLAGPFRQIDYSAAVTVVTSPRWTIAGEIMGRRGTAGGLTEVVEPHPSLIGIDTIRLTGAEQPGTRLIVAGGVRWNVSGRWLLNASVLRSITTGGLTAAWVPTVTMDYSFGR
jgi:Putative MetA-pathway of phenol degradation